MIIKMKLNLLLLLVHFSASIASPLPVLMWHGMGDTCCNPLSLGRIKHVIEENVPGIYVASVEIGSNQLEDQLSGFFSDVNKQVEEVCETVKKDAKLRGGFNAVGFSQGGQFLRALVQRCSEARVRNLVSVGGQHQGVYGLPHCPVVSIKLCNTIRELLNRGAYADYLQNHLVQAQYWHDPLNEQLYRQSSHFIADVNQESGAINATYRNNLLRLNNFVLVKFLNDTMVVPRDSEWFEFYEPGQEKTITPLRNSTIYKKDVLGLKQLDAQGKLKFISIAGDHLRFTEEWFVDNIVKLYLQ